MVVVMHMKYRLFLLLMVVLFNIPCRAQSRKEDVATQPQPQNEQANPLIHETYLPLSEGKADLGEILGEILDWLGIHSQLVRNRCAKMMIPVTGAVGQIKLHTLGQITHGVVVFTATDDELVMRVDRSVMRKENKIIRSKLRENMEKWFPDLAKQAYDQYGLWSVRPNGMLGRLPNQFQMDHVVILVHGLDEPGDIWDELAPDLTKAGHTPLIFLYPNDQPIVDSAKLLTQELNLLPAKNIKVISIVAHSMGGLVSREVLTNPTLIGYPQVQRLITVGTPHHGSNLAHFQFVGELRDQVVRMFSGNGVLFGSVFDGAGEAKIDLLPQSSFLKTLNARPLPKDVKMTSIIGIASPVKIEAIRDLESKFSELLNADGKEKAAAVRLSLEQLVQGLGDGCVSMDSAHLQGVLDEVVLKANHRTLLRTVPLVSHGKPPAIDVIVARLSEKNDD